MKLRPTTYTFDASAKTIACDGFTSLEAIQLITNVTDNIIIYNFADSTKGGSLSGTTLTLAFNTTSMADTDKLQILIEDGSTTEAVTVSGVSTADKQDLLLTELQAKANLDETQPVSLASVPSHSVTNAGTFAVQATGTLTANAGTNLNTSALALESGGNLDTIATKDFATQTTLALVKAKTDNIPALGQALEAASVPVVLPAAQVTTLTPPPAITGFATDTKQDTIIGHVDGVETLLSTIDSDTSTLASTVSGAEMQVDVVTLPTVTIDKTGLATDATDTNTATIAGDTTSIDSKIPALGQALAASSVPVVLTAAQVTTLTPPAAITGFATAAKQLADNHQVTVSNIANTPVITGFATETTLASIKNTDGIKKITDALPTGTNSIGKISEITTSVIPGTGATNLGKARGNTVGATDTGIGVLAKITSADAHTTDEEGDYDTLSLTDFHELRTRDQRAIDLANCNVYTDYTALGTDTTGLANSTNHVFGTGALSFNKVNGDANTVYGGVSRSFTALNLSEIFEAGAFVGLSCYLSSLTNVINVFLRIGTDSTNYNSWTWAASDLAAAAWLNLRKSAAQPDHAKSAGNGWNPGAVSYVAFGVEFNSEVNTLSGILMDHVHIVGGRITAADNTTSISSTVNTPNININKIGGTSTDVNNGTVSGGTQRVTIASDSTGQIKLAAGTAEIGKLAAGTALVGKVGIDQTTPGTTNKVSLGSDVVHTIVDSATLGTVTVSGALTDGELRATAVPVSLASVPSHAVTNAGTFAVQSTNQANSGVDIGDVTINNASGAAAVNIQDGGNAITVDGAVAVTNATAANLKAEVVGTGTFATQSTLAAETTKVIGVVRTADGSGNLLTSTTNALDVNIKSGKADPTIPTASFAGQKVVAVTNTAIAISTSQAVSGVIIQALAANTNNIYVGPSTVTTANGFELQPGQATSVAIDNLSKIYINGTATDGICFIGS